MLWTTGLRLFKEQIGKGAYGAVFTADYPFNGIDDKGQEFLVLGSSFSSFGCFVFEFRVFVFEFWVLRFRDLGASCFGLRFRVLRFRNYHYVIPTSIMYLLKAFLE